VVHAFSVSNAVAAAASAAVQQLNLGTACAEFGNDRNNQMLSRATLNKAGGETRHFMVKYEVTSA